MAKTRRMTANANPALKQTFLVGGNRPYLRWGPHGTNFLMGGGPHNLSLELPLIPTITVTRLVHLLCSATQQCPWLYVYRAFPLWYAEWLAVSLRRTLVATCQHAVDNCVALQISSTCRHTHFNERYVVNATLLRSLFRLSVCPSVSLSLF